MKRRVFNIAAAGSFVLLAAVVTSWVVSYWRPDHFGGESAMTSDRRQRGGGISFSCGTVTAEFWSRQYAKAPPPQAVGGGWTHFSGHVPNVDAVRASQQAWLARLQTRSYFGFAYARWNDSAFGGPRAQPLPGQIPQIVQTSRYLLVPHWSLAVVTGLLPLAWFVHFRKTHRRAARLARGCCTECGYDIRATPDRCPECGAVMAELSP